MLVKTRAQLTRKCGSIQKWTLTAIANKIFILCYVNKILVVHHNAMNMLKNIDNYFRLKPDLIGDNNMNLGASYVITGPTMTCMHGC